MKNQRKKIKNKFMRALVAIFVMKLSSCTVSRVAPHELQGVYIQKENKNIQLQLRDHNFLFIDKTIDKHHPVYDCCDTLTYGYWEYDKKGFIKLTSDPDLLLPLKILVKESKNNIDSVYFIIDNPMEQFYRETERKQKGIVYFLDVSSNNLEFEYKFFDYYTINKIVLDKPSSAKIEKFMIYTLPNYTFEGRSIGERIITTIEYKVENLDANIFEINIPKLNYGLLTFTRLYEDYVLIINKNKLKWDGKEYVRNSEISN